MGLRGLVAMLPVEGADGKAVRAPAGLFLTGTLRGKRFEDMVLAGGNETQAQNDSPASLEVRHLLLFLLALLPAFVVFYQYRSTMFQYFLDWRLPPRPAIRLNSLSDLRCCSNAT